MKKSVAKLASKKLTCPTSYFPPNFSFVFKNGPEIIILSEVSQRKTNITWHCLYAESKKKSDTNELIYKTEIDSQT